jgi:putative tricarboxylic transport membrane protein
VAVIGLFGIGEILLTLEEGLAFRGAKAKINMRVVLDTWKELPRYWLTSLRSSRSAASWASCPAARRRPRS